jgi:tRNA (guanine37-N1)-methyltransferase
VAAVAMLEAIFRLLPGAIGKIDSALADSFSDTLLGPAVWTRPAEFRGHKVPEVMVSGDHARQERFRRWNSLEQTINRRPDLLRRVDLSDDDRRMMGQVTAGMKFEDCY